ncbi:unnamed protein product [Discosporangium mesarthrocarpum]
MRPEMIRAVVLVTLVVQNSALALFMRYSRSAASKHGDEGPMYASTTAVVVAETVKMVSSLLLQYQADGSLKKLASTLTKDMLDEPLDTLKMAVPACLYVLQNNLAYLAVSNLDGPTYQLLYQLKILTTAVFSVAMLNRVLAPVQWVSLLMLAVGVAMVQISGSKEHESGGDGGEHKMLRGFLAVLLACCTSGFAGVYFEKVLKGSTISLWVRNMQLAGYGMALGIWAVYMYDWDQVSAKGFLFGYNFSVWMAVMLNSLGGLIVAMVVKYADNLIKGFATSISIVMTCVISVFLFNFEISAMFVVGAFLVLYATFLYSKKRVPSPEEIKPTSAASDYESEALLKKGSEVGTLTRTFSSRETRDRDSSSV